MNHMKAFLAILAFVALIAVVYFIRYIISKGINAAATSLNKNVLFKSKIKEQQQFISTALTFVTTAPVSEIMRALTAYVAPQQSVPVVRGAIYQLSSSANQVYYAFGNKLYPQIFVVSVSLANRGETTQGVFQFVRWHEKEGMVTTMEVINNFRNKIISAFSAADPNVRITEGTVMNDFAQPAAVRSNSNPVKWKCSCGTYNNTEDAFCADCGRRKL